MLNAFALVFAGFLGTELISIPLHRYVFHGPLWSVHRSHHSPRHGALEHNDIFSLFFAGLSIGLMALGFLAPEYRGAFFVGLGICVYGAVYFVVHDLMAHKRYYPLRPNNRWLKALVVAHRRHHQRVDKRGQGPWGLFLYRYDLHHPIQQRRRTNTSALNKSSV